MSAMRPHSKREWRRSSMVGISLGGQSLVMTICFWASYRALNVWKNSSWVRSLPGDELDIVHEQDVDARGTSGGTGWCDRSGWS